MFAHHISVAFLRNFPIVANIPWNLLHLNWLLYQLEALAQWEDGWSECFLFQFPLSTWVLYTTQPCEVPPPHKLYINMCTCRGFSPELCALRLICNMQKTLGTAHCSWSYQVHISCVIVCWHITEWWQPGYPRDQVHTKLSCTLLLWCGISTFCGAVLVSQARLNQFLV